MGIKQQPTLPGSLSRRGFLQATAAATAAGVFGTAGMRSAAAVRPGLAAEVIQKGFFEGTQYASETEAIMLAGEPGAYAARGTWTSAPLASGSASGKTQVSWYPRWTTPLAWDRFAGNPVMSTTPGTWDDTTVTTCSMVRTGDKLKMFYGARNRGIGLAVSDINHLDRWRKTGRPVLQAGKRGAFDAGGVLSPAVVPVTDSHWYMYYVGYDPERVFNPGRIQGPVLLHQIGLAESRDQGETWTRVTDQPVIPTGPAGSVDGVIVSSNTVLKVGNKWYNWYTGNSQVPYLSSICLATSDDGVHWDKYPYNPVLSYNPYIETEAFMVATPHVLYEDGVFKMWYNSKGYGDGRVVGDYRIGYAESLDGIHWDRSPILPVLGPSDSGWDSQMVEYPEALNIDGNYYLWYTGDGYGTLGFATGRSLARANVETRTGDAATPDSGWSDWVSLDSPQGSRLNRPRKYVQIRVTLETDDRAVTPMVQRLAFLVP